MCGHHHAQIDQRRVDQGGKCLGLACGKPGKAAIEIR